MTQKRIIIMLNPTDLTLADWVILNDETVTQAEMQGQLSDLTLLSKYAYITAIVPAADVLLTQTNLPKLNRHKLLQALPYALEENLIEDVTQLHFAIGDQQADGTVPVAVVAKSKIQLWIDAFKSVDIEPLNMIPMTLALPQNEDVWQVYSYHQSKIIRTGKYTGFAADDSMFENVLSVMPDKPEIQLQDLSNKTLLERISITLPTVPPINLLQGPYRSKRKTSRTKNVWKYAGFAAATWLAAAFLSNLISFLILHFQASSIDSQIEHIYYQHFPHATSTVAPRERMEQKLKEITSAAQKNNFLSLLATVGKSLSHTTGIRLQNLDYRNGLLTLDVSSATFDSLDMLTRDLNANGLTVKQQNSATSGSQVKATLLINAGAS